MESRDNILFLSLRFRILFHRPWKLFFSANFIFSRDIEDWQNMIQREIGSFRLLLLYLLFWLIVLLSIKYYFLFFRVIWSFVFVLFFTCLLLFLKFFLFHLVLLLDMPIIICRCKMCWLLLSVVFSCIVLCNLSPFEDVNSTNTLLQLALSQSVVFVCLFVLSLSCESITFLLFSQLGFFIILFT